MSTQEVAKPTIISGIQLRDLHSRLKRLQTQLKNLGTNFTFRNAAKKSGTPLKRLLNKKNNKKFPLETIVNARFFAIFFSSSAEVVPMAVKLSHFTP